jgi:hypothetical protein
VVRPELKRWISSRQPRVRALTRISVPKKIRQRKLHKLCSTNHEWPDCTSNVFLLRAFGDVLFTRLLPALECFGNTLIRFRKCCLQSIGWAGNAAAALGEDMGVDHRRADVDDVPATPTRSGCRNHLRGSAWRTSVAVCGNEPTSECARRGLRTKRLAARPIQATDNG